MRLTNSKDRYGAVPQFLHWAVVALVITAWLLGQFIDDLPRGTLAIHIALGLGVLVFLVARLAWRFSDPPPEPEPTALGPWLDVAGRLAHYLMYLLLALVPIAGIVTQFARGDAVSIFGLYEIASPWVKDRAFARSVTEVHEILANALVIFAGLHAVAALVHHWILRDRTLLRMLPGA
ncbi:MAG: cytochrome b [Xanthobacteraceae bacterium]|nr:cytochrome b [Xanthobacteraceae bacterium]